MRWEKILGVVMRSTRKKEGAYKQDWDGSWCVNATPIDGIPVQEFDSTHGEVSRHPLEK